MSDNVNIIVQDTINEIVVNSAIIVENVDINVQAAVDEVNIIANPNNYIININRIIGEQVQSDWNETDINAADYIKNKPTIPAEQVNSDWNATSGKAEILNKPTIPAAVTKTSDLINDGEDGINPFITLEDIPTVTGFVPYIGATEDVNLGDFGVQLGNIEFDTTPTNAPTGVGSMYWNDTDGTLDLKLKGGNVTLQIGQEQVTRIVNKTGANLLESEYKVVYISGAQGNRLKCGLALANNDALSNATFGIVTENINVNQEGFITSNGLVRGINTTGSLQSETWIDGDILYLSATILGGITNIKPTAPNHTVMVGYVVNSNPSVGSIYVKVQIGFGITELHDVSANSPNNNDVLTYESATTLWKPKTVVSALGYTPYNATNPNGYTSNLGTVTSVAALTLGTTGTDLSSTVANGTTTPVITLNVPTASATNRGALSTTDWSAFNSKFTLPSLTSGSVLFSDGTTIAQKNSNFFWDNTNNRLGLGMTPTARLSIKAPGALSTDIALRVRNSADTADLVVSNGIGDFGIGVAPTLGRLHLQGRTGQTTLYLKQAGDGQSDGIIMYGLSSSQSSRIFIDGGGSMVFNKAGTNIMAVTLTGVVIGATTPLSSAFLQVDSTTKGFLPPRMTNAQRTAIATPAVGLVVYCTDTIEGLYINKSTGWTFII